MLNSFRDYSVAKSTFRGRTGNIFEASQTCPIQRECRACSYINKPYEASLKEKWSKDVEVFRSQLSLTSTQILEPQKSPKPTGYRTTAKLAVRPVPKKLFASPSEQRAERFAIGLFKPESHDIVDIRKCPLHADAIRQCLGALKTELEESTLSPWNEKTQVGDLKYLLIRCNPLTKELLINFVVAHDGLSETLKGIVKTLRTRRVQVDAAFVHIHAGDSNAIFSGTTEKIIGHDHIRESIGGLTLYSGPTSFMQVNPYQADILYRRVQQHAGRSRLQAASQQQEVAWDLYCGMGPISFLLAQSGFQVFGVEENPEAIRDAQKNRTANSLTERQVIFKAGKVEELAELLSTLPGSTYLPSVIVTNPSRKGLSESVRSSLVAPLSSPQLKTFLYVSCDITTLIRDLKDITEKTPLKLRQLESFDMFAQTDKLEWLAVLTA